MKSTPPEISPLHLPLYADAHARYAALVDRRASLERSGRPPVRVPVETLAEQLLANPTATLAFKAPEPTLPLGAELAALRLAEQHAEQDLRAARDAASVSACEKVAPTRHRLIEEAIAGLSAGLKAIEAEMNVRQALGEAGYDDIVAPLASHIDLDTLGRLLERAREVGRR